MDATQSSRESPSSPAPLCDSTHYCVIAHTEFARLNGATDAEVTEAVAMAALTRNMSTLVNGLKVEEKEEAQMQNAASQ